MASAKVDGRGSFGSKRSRNDVSRRDGDWTCTQCGNVNFSFRTECNRQSCCAARSSASPRVGSTPVRGAYGHPAAYMSVGAPPPMPFGMAGYGSPYPIPGMRYEYGPPSGAPGPYGFPSPYGPPGPMGGMGYGLGPSMNQYGFGYRGSPHPVGPWIEGTLHDNGASRKRRGGPDGLSEGDWICPKCENVNFAFRNTCNIKKCGTSKPTASKHGSSGKKSHPEAPEGSWTCSKCGNINYPFRTACNRKGCGSDKPSESQ